jgi:hypothetical protein
MTTALSEAARLGALRAQLAELTGHIHECGDDWPDLLRDIAATVSLIRRIESHA